MGTPTLRSVVREAAVQGSHALGNNGVRRTEHPPSVPAMWPRVPQKLWLRDKDGFMCVAVKSGQKQEAWGGGREPREQGPNTKGPAARGQAQTEVKKQAEELPKT